MDPIEQKRRQLEEAAARRAAEQLRAERARLEAEREALARESAQFRAQHAELQRQREALEREAEAAAAPSPQGAVEGDLFNTLAPELLRFAAEPARAPLEPPVADRIECPFCAELIRMNAKVCRFCGHPLAREEPEPPAPGPRRRLRPRSSGEHSPPRSSGRHAARTSSSARHRAVEGRAPLDRPEVAPAARPTVWPILLAAAVGLVLFVIIVASSAPPPPPPPPAPEVAASAEPAEDTRPRDLAVADPAEQEARRQDLEFEQGVLDRRRRARAQQLETRSDAAMRELARTNDMALFSAAEAALTQSLADPACSPALRSSIEEALKQVDYRRQLIAEREYGRAFQLGTRGEHAAALQLAEQVERVLRVPPTKSLQEGRERWKAALARERARQAELAQAAAARLEAEAAKVEGRKATVEDVKRQVLALATAFYQARLPEALACGGCGGQGAVSCPGCAAGRVACDACRGKGRRPCSRCQGQGKVRVVVFGQGGGSGEQECGACAGVGVGRCGACLGEGRVTCKRCAGTDSVACAACEASIAHAAIDRLVGYLSPEAQRRVNKGRKRQLLEHALRNPIAVREGTIGYQLGLEEHHVIVLSRVRHVGAGSETVESTRWIRVGKRFCLASEYDTQLVPVLPKD